MAIKSASTNRRAPNASTKPTDPAFVDVAEHAGLHYRWKPEGGRPLNILQGIGNGCAFLDYDNDGNLDALLVGPRLALFRGDGKGHFTDVTHSTGLDSIHGHFLGCAVGDYDNDGYDDVYLSGYQCGALLHNVGGRGFQDASREAGIGPQPWGASCSFVDVDNDGLLDLYVGNYVVFGPATQPRLCNQHAIMTACGPDKYREARGVLYHNLGHGRFHDVTALWGYNRVSGKALGVAASPEPTGMQSLLISNDAVPADLMEYGKTGGRNRGVDSGMAFGADNKPYGGMGIDCGDYNNDGSIDIAVSTYQNQPRCIFNNESGTYVVQDAYRLGLTNSTPYVAFGVKWFDFDNDGWLDLMFTNGHVMDNIADVYLYGGPGANYRQPIQLYRNRNGARFDDVTERLDSRSRMPIVGRGLAVGDFDNDGRMDALAVDMEGAPVLLHNVTRGGHWLTIKLQGRRCNRDGYGAVITVETGGRKLVRHCHADGSYLSSSDKRIHFGLGGGTQVDRIEVRWPNGHVDRFSSVAANQVVVIIEGAARVKASGK